MCVGVSGAQGIHKGISVQSAHPRGVNEQVGAVGPLCHLPRCAQEPCCPHADLTPWGSLQGWLHRPLDEIGCPRLTLLGLARPPAGQGPRGSLQVAVHVGTGDPLLA